VLEEEPGGAARASSSEESASESVAAMKECDRVAKQLEERTRLADLAGPWDWPDTGERSNRVARNKSSYVTSEGLPLAFRSASEKSVSFSSNVLRLDSSGEEEEEEEGFSSTLGRADSVPFLRSRLRFIAFRRIPRLRSTWRRGG
jgi:hypothetical protein